MAHELALNGQQQIKDYFDGVLKLYKSGEEFPVNLDDVWPLAYGRKSDAVEALQKNFMQDIDYQVLRQNPQNPNGGRPVDEYHLTIECLEYFIARKVREVFNVYRAVFKKVATGEVAVLPKDYASALRELADQVERNEQLLIENKQQQEQLIEQSCQISEMSNDIDVMRPKAEYYDMLLNNKSTVLTTQIAQDYGMSAIAFNKLLANLGVQHKMNGQWILKSKFASNGYVKNKTIDIVRSNGMRDVKIQTVWTPNGMIFLYRILKKNGILPMIER